MKAWNLALILFFVSSSGRSRRHKNRKSILRQVRQPWMALDGCGYLSQFVQLNIAKFVNCTTRLLAEFHRVFWLSQIFKSTSCAIPSILRSTLFSSSAFSTGDSIFRSNFLEVGSSGLSVGFPCSGARRRSLRSVLLRLLRLPRTLKYNLRRGTMHRQSLE